MLPRVNRFAPAFVALAVLAAGCGGTTKTAAPKKQAAPPPPPTQHFRSRPDLKPPPVRILTAAKKTAPGDIFLAPKMKVLQAGPMIINNPGQGVWFHPRDTHRPAHFPAHRDPRTA